MHTFVANRVLSRLRTCSGLFCPDFLRHLGFNSDFLQISEQKTGGWGLWYQRYYLFKKSVFHVKQTGSQGAASVLDCLIWNILPRGSFYSWRRKISTPVISGPLVCLVHLHHVWDASMIHLLKYLEHWLYAFVFNRFRLSGMMRQESNLWKRKRWYHRISKAY